MNEIQSGYPRETSRQDREEFQRKLNEIGHPSFGRVLWADDLGNLTEVNIFTALIDKVKSALLGNVSHSGKSFVEYNVIRFLQNGLNGQKLDGNTKGLIEALASRVGFNPNQEESSLNKYLYSLVFLIKQTADHQAVEIKEDFAAEYFQELSAAKSLKIKFHEIQNAANLILNPNNSSLTSVDFNATPANKPSSSISEEQVKSSSEEQVTSADLGESNGDTKVVLLKEYAEEIGGKPVIIASNSENDLKKSDWKRTALISILGLSALALLSVVFTKYFLSNETKFDIIWSLDSLDSAVEFAKEVGNDSDPNFFMSVITKLYNMNSDGTTFNSYLNTLSEAIKAPKIRLVILGANHVETTTKGLFDHIVRRLEFFA